MRAALFHEFGGIDKIVVEDVADPKPAPNEVLIKVGACALNHLDVDFREGISRFPVDPGGAGHAGPHCYQRTVLGDFSSSVAGRGGEMGY